MPKIRVRNDGAQNFSYKEKDCKKCHSESGGPVPDDDDAVSEPVTKARV